MVSQGEKMSGEKKWKSKEIEGGNGFFLPEIRSILKKNHINVESKKVGAININPNRISIVYEE